MDDFDQVRLERWIFDNQNAEPLDYPHRVRQLAWKWRSETDTMEEAFYEIREMIHRLYEWFRQNRQGSNSVLLTKLLAENCESTLLRLFG